MYWGTLTDVEEHQCVGHQPRPTPSMQVNLSIQETHHDRNVILQSCNPEQCAEREHEGYQTDHDYACPRLLPPKQPVSEQSLADNHNTHDRRYMHTGKKNMNKPRKYGC
jgi:hypothetical protein